MEKQSCICWKIFIPQQVFGILSYN